MTASKLLVKREGDFHYPICFEEDFSNLAQVMKEEGLVDRKICIVTDSNVGPLYEEAVKQVLSEVSSDISVFTFEAGEKNKNLNTVSALYQALIQNGLDRKSLHHRSILFLKSHPFRRQTVLPEAKKECLDSYIQDVAGKAPTMFLYC